MFLDDCGHSQQDNAPCHTAKLSQECFEEHNDKFEVKVLTSKSQSSHAPFGCTAKTVPVHGGPTLQLIGLKGSAPEVLGAYTTV